MTTSTSRHGRTSLTLVGIGLLLATLTACTPSGSNNANSSELKPGDSTAKYNEWAADYQSCMKDEGISINVSSATSAGDAPSSEDGAEAVDPGELDPEAMAAADKKCLGKVGAPPVMPRMSEADVKELNEASLRFAACMRERGYDYPDPEISSDGSVGSMSQAMSADEIDPVDMDACSAEAKFPEMNEK